MRQRHRVTLALVGALALLPALRGPANTQDGVQPDMQLDEATRRQVIDGVLARLNAAYVFPETAKEMETAIRGRDTRREYDGLTSARALADSLTSHLRAVSRDKHLRVLFSARPLPTAEPRAEPSPEARQRAEQSYRANNFGFSRVERLEGNVGYLELRGFANAEVAGAEETVAAAMGFLANTDALIVDLRRNGGGSPRMVELLSSYLFGPERVHLNSLYWRPDDRTEEYWTRSELKGPRYGPDRPVYVLTSGRTFSAAEEFTYNLRSLKRATVVGETTGGGAHPGGPQRVTDHFSVWVPSGRAINPVTGTNWEGTGVEPHVKVPQAEALEVAHLAALRAALERATVPQHREALEQLIRDREAP